MIAVPTELINSINAGKSFLVSAHYDPDGDAVGSTVGLGLFLQELGKKSVHLYNRDPVPYNVRSLPQVEQLTSSLPEIGSVDTIIILDCSESKRVGTDFEAFAERSRRLGARMLCIDHHTTASAEADVIYLDPKASAAGILVMRLIRTMGADLSLNVATNLYTAIITDTGSFRYSSTNAEAHRCAAEMIDAGVQPWQISSEIYENEPLDRVRLLAKVLSTLTLSPDGRTASMEVPLSMLEGSSLGSEHLDGFVNYGRSIRGVEVAALIREHGPGEWKISMRSRGNVDVSKVASALGGGGHKNAAGARVRAESLEEVKVQLWHLVDKALADADRAKDKDVV